MLPLGLYSDTIIPEEYISGILNGHLWLNDMYGEQALQIATEILRLLEERPNRRILIYDLGCGPGHFVTRFLIVRLLLALGHRASTVSIVGIDESDAFIEHANRELGLLPATFRRLAKFRRENILTAELEKAHIIVTAGVWHHFDDEAMPVAAKKVASVLVRGGLLVDGDEQRASPEWFEHRWWCLEF